MVSTRRALTKSRHLTEASYPAQEVAHNLLPLINVGSDFGFKFQERTILAVSHLLVTSVLLRFRFAWL